MTIVKAIYGLFMLAAGLFMILAPDDRPDRHLVYYGFGTCFVIIGVCAIWMVVLQRHEE